MSDGKSEPVHISKARLFANFVNVHFPNLLPAVAGGITAASVSEVLITFETPISIDAETGLRCNI